MKERRWKRFWVDESVILELFLNFRGADCLMVPVLSDRCGVPKDVEVVAVHADPLRKGFQFTLAHPSFDVVLPGEIIPAAGMPLGFQVETIVIRHDDGPTPYIVAPKEEV